MDVERLEEELLAPAATRSATSKGRERPEEPDPWRTAFEHDRDRIVHAKAFRRLKHKTQVFVNPEGDHYVTRLTHALQVTQIGRSLARYLGLNETLTEAICLGHDVGHSPFGHTGEDALSIFVPGEWLHSRQSVRIFRLLEPLNLTWETLDGIRAHSWKIVEPPATPEGWLCRYADRIAYLSHDVEDAVRAGVITYDDLPSRACAVFGDPRREWVGSMIDAVACHTRVAGAAGMETEALDAMHELRDFMFARVYLRPETAPQREHVVDVVTTLVEHFASRPEEVPTSYRQDDADDLTRAIDYVAGMTDRFALDVHDRVTAG